MKPVLKRKIIATLVAGSLLLNVYSVAKMAEQSKSLDKGYSSNALKAGEKQGVGKLPVSSMPKEKITGKINLKSNKKRLIDEEIDINL